MYNSSTAPLSRAQRNRPNFLSSDRCAIFTVVSSYSEKAKKLKNGNAVVTDSITSCLSQALSSLVWPDSLRIRNLALTDGVTIDTLVDI